jgi:tripartite-type tricarboxylate transporter receptor subunit TctC
MRPRQVATYPNRPVRIIVPYAAGGPTDTIARIVAQKLSEGVGQQFYVENHVGASSKIGTRMAASAPADGYTILFGTNDLAVQYDPSASFVPVTLAAESPEVIVVHPSVPAKTVRELISLLAANPGRYSFASPGAETSTHFAAERLFRISNGLDVVHVPFNGGAPAIAATIGGHTGIAFTALPPATPYIKDGTLRALAVTGSRRSPPFPDVQTLEEAGFPDHESEVMVAVVVPPGTPKEIVELLHGEIVRIVASPDVKNHLADLGFEPVASTPDEFAARLKSEIAKWDTVARALNMKRE